MGDLARGTAERLTKEAIEKAEQLLIESEEKAK